MADTDQLREARRAALTVGHNPRADVDYLVGVTRDFDGVAIAGSDASVTLHLRYVPDRDVLAHAAWPAYIAQLAETAWPDLESLATIVFDDLINELVPRWLCLKLAAGNQYVVLQDRQPTWHNADLLSADGNAG